LSKSARAAPKTDDPQLIGRLLLSWYARGHRDLPWRNTRDPYRIWISEIMLQQTRAQTVIPYYTRFLERFPTIESLAAATEDEVLVLWSGLGYYSRARNLRAAAQKVVACGGFPREFDTIRDLPGIGDYTAAAIASIAFGLPHAVLDGNVLRVVARVTNDASDIGAGKTRERFREVAQSWLEPTDPAHFNQALMELGATVCLPRNPLCLLCPVAQECQGRAEDRLTQLPVKLRPTEPVQIQQTLLIVKDRRRVMLRLRSGRGRMTGFWDLPTMEELPHARRLGVRHGEFRHTITHHHYTFTVIDASVPLPADEHFRWVAGSQLSSIPLATTARKALALAGIVYKL